jgi:hydrogenase maturation protease
LRSLVIGYGNPSRRDDGAGLAVVNGLRERLGRPPLAEGEDGFEELGAAVDTLFLQQLMPELAETLARYDRVWFVDAHVGLVADLVRRVTLEPGFEPASVSHHLKPETLLALAAQLFGRAPRAELFSIRGSDFDFGAGLSSDTAEGARQVVVELWSRTADEFEPMNSECESSL